MNQPEETVLGRVQRNDPTETHLIVTYEPRHSIRHGAALQGNTVVNDLEMSLFNFTGNDEDFDLLLNWIQTSQSLRNVKLWHCNNQQITRRCLQAYVNNAAIQEVQLLGIPALDAEAFALFLRSARPKLKLRLYRVGFRAAGDGPVREIQEALRGNTSLQSLSIERSTSQVYTTILPLLSTCHAINEVDLCPPNTDRAQAIQAMEEFLQSPPATVEHLGLEGFRNDDEYFESILQLLERTDAITKMTFDWCTFSEAATTQFKNMFQSNTVIQTLVLSRFIHFRGPNNADYTNAQVTEFIRENNTLKELDVANLVSRDRRSVIFRSLEDNSTIERLNCGNLENDSLLALVNNLPNYKGVKELKFSLRGRYKVPKEDVLRAFARNGSLTRVRIEQADGRNYFTATDLRKIHFYTLRNKHAPGTLAASMDEVPVSLRPKIYSALRGSSAAPALILGDLRRLGDKVGTSDKASCRKRKRVEDTTTCSKRY